MSRLFPLLFVAGCVHQPTLYAEPHPFEVPASVCIDDGGITQHETVLEAMRTINQRLGFHAFVPADFDSGCDVRINMRGAYEIDETSRSRVPERGGVTQWVGDVCAITIFNVTGSERFYATEHELLHCLGLDHDSVTGSIMYPSQPNNEEWHGPLLTPRVMDADRRALRRRFL